MLPTSLLLSSKGQRCCRRWERWNRARFWRSIDAGLGGRKGVRIADRVNAILDIEEGQAAVLEGQRALEQDVERQFQGSQVRQCVLDSNKQCEG